MACPQFEDLMEGGEAVEAHLEVCAECQAWREALAEVDSTLALALSDVCAPATLQTRVQACIRPVPIAPAVFDLVGGMGVISVLLLLAFNFWPDMQVDLNTLFAIGGLFLLGSIGLAYRAIIKA